MSAVLDAAALQALVERYFAAVDRMDMAATLACFEPQAQFSIVNHGLHRAGRDTEIRAMFEGLNQRYARVWHGNFEHVIDVPNQRVASRFTVRNTTFDGQELVKHNCNFFSVSEGLFDEVRVYMSGDNSLR